jgi:peptidoglycan/LPS O-acetylase OafA/YrhL
MEPEIRHKPIRYYEIDLLRFIAALAVVFFHYTYRGYHGNHLSPVEYPALGEVFKYGYLGVQLFFMISGYVVLLSAQGKTLGQFFTSRVMRLYPAYWVACTLCFVVVRLFGPAVHTPGWSVFLDASIKSYLYSMSMLQSFFGVRDLDGVYWTLGVEISFYFLVALLIAFRWMKHLLLVLSVWLAYCALASTVLSDNAFSVLLFPQHAPFFIAGMVFYLLQTRQAAPWRLYVLLTASYVLSLKCAFVTAAANTASYQQVFSPLVAVTILTCCFGLFLLIIYRKINLGHAKWLGWAGALTYPLYLLHHNIGFVLYQHLGGRVEKYTLLMGIVLLMLVAAYALHQLVEKRFSKPLGQLVARQLTALSD